MIDNEVTEVADEVVKVAERSLHGTPDGYQTLTRDSISEYIAAIDDETAKNILYALLRSENSHAVGYALKAINAFGLVDWSQTRDLLALKNVDERQVALKVLSDYKMHEEQCVNCQRDRRGLRYDTVVPEKVKFFLKKGVRELKATYRTTTTP